MAFFACGRLRARETIPGWVFTGSRNASFWTGIDKNLRERPNDWVKVRVKRATFIRSIAACGDVVRCTKEIKPGIWRVVNSRVRPGTPVPEGASVIIITWKVMGHARPRLVLDFDDAHILQ